MSKELNQGFIVNAPAPIDSRMVVETYSELGNIAILYTGLLSYIIDEGVFYVFNGSTWNKWTSGSVAEWGSITGDITTQTDLQDELFLRYLKTGGTITGLVDVTDKVQAHNFILVGSEPGEVVPTTFHSQLTLNDGTNPHGTNLVDLSDVDDTDIADGKVLAYDSASSTHKYKSFIPYTGSTEDVDLGSHGLKTYALSANDIYGFSAITVSSDLSWGSLTGLMAIGDIDFGGYGTSILFDASKNYGELIGDWRVSSNKILRSDGDILTLPSNTGTLALTSDFSNTQTLVYNIPVNGVTSTQLIWIGEQRVEAAAQTGTYATDFGCNNQHAALDVLSLTGSGMVVFTGVSMSESSGIPIATTESFLVDATGKYQTTKKWAEITNVEIPAGITAISYNIGVLGYEDLHNQDFKITGIRVDMLSSGVNSQMIVHIKKIQDDGDNKITVVDIERYGVSALTDSYVDEVRTGADDRSYTCVSDLWTSGENACIKVSDYDTFFINDENIFESSTKGEGFIIDLDGIGGGVINNVSMLNLSITIELL